MSCFIKEVFSSSSRKFLAKNHWFFNFSQNTRTYYNFRGRRRPAFLLTCRTTVILGLRLFCFCGIIPFVRLFLKRFDVVKFIKKNTVFCIAALAAVITCFFVPPDRDYFGYFDWGTLSCLFLTLAVVCALRNIKFFTIVARRLVNAASLSRFWRGEFGRMLLYK